MVPLVQLMREGRKLQDRFVEANARLDYLQVSGGIADLDPASVIVERNDATIDRKHVPEVSDPETRPASDARPDSSSGPQETKGPST